jgi:hypothetical protein
MVGSIIMGQAAQREFPDLRAEYRPRAIYLEDVDTVEYVKRDGACVYRRVDGILTLALDLHSRELVGFRFKGFKNFFLTRLKPRYDLLDDHFIPLVAVIEAALDVICCDVFDEQRRKAYRDVRKMAHEDKVALDGPMPAAA